MRRLSALLCAALLGACTVDVEGAPCTVPGATTDCPGGQACGNDRRCSARALACAASRCTPAVGDACLDPAGLGSGTALARWCSDADPVCGSWVVDRCADQGLECGGRSGAARCECPPAATRALAVLPGGAPVDAPPYATGAATPAACAFRTLTDALIRAGELRRLDPATVVTVTAGGAPAGSTVTFSATAGERFVLNVGRGVVLRADPASGGTYEIVQDQPTPATAVVLYAGATLEGFTIRNVTGGADHHAVFHLCAGREEPTRVSRVILDARGAGSARYGIGLHATQPCPLRLEDVQIRNAGVGILWEPDPAGTAQLTVAGGAVTGGSGAGIVATGGRLLVDGARVEGNAGRGIEAAGAAVELRGARIVRNGDTGVALSGAGEVRLGGNTIWANGATTAWGGAATPSGIARRAGGLVLSGTPPAALEVRGNRIYGNGGDQVLFLGPGSATWNLDQPACSDAAGLLANVLGCFDPAPAGTTGASRGLVAIDAGASAQNQWWGPGGPAASDAVQLPSGTAIPVTTGCLWATPALACDSEDPPP
jgi:hypothetical protein